MNFAVSRQPTSATTMNRLTPAQRRATCIHEAGHAVAFALGGVSVHRLAVADEGAAAWRTDIRNGRVTRSSTVTFAVEITPRKAGPLDIPPITVTVDGREVKSRPMRVDVRASDAVDLLSAEIFAKRPEVWVGEPLELVEQPWNSDAWSGGAFTSFPAPGSWSSHARLAAGLEGGPGPASHGRVLWAGTEVSPRWPGYFEGAIEAGERAAAAAAQHCAESQQL